MAPGHSLHVPALSIQGLRGVRKLRLPRLGRVTLIAGRNAVGKTTILDAVRIYASRGDTTLAQLLYPRDEVVVSDVEDETIFYPDYAALFHRDNCGEPVPKIEIASDSPTHSVTIQLCEADPLINIWHLLDDPPRGVTVSLGGKERSVLRPSPMGHHAPGGRPPQDSPHQPLFQRTQPPGGSWPAAIPQESLGPGPMGSRDIGRLWHDVVFTDGEDLAVRAVGLAVGKDIERLNVLEYVLRRGPVARGVVKMSGTSRVTPIKSLGDGASRLFGIALALANSRNGLLLLDEVENGIHYSVQAELWKMILGIAERANTQVLATTHSWDCIVGFAQAALDSDGAGVLYRLDRLGPDIRGIEYSTDMIRVAAEQRIEVR